MSVKQKFIDRIRVAQEINTKDENTFPSVVYIEDNETDGYYEYDGANIVLIKLDVSFRLNQLVDRNDQFELDAVKQQMAREMDDYFYGNIKQELIDAIIELQYEFNTYNSKGIQKLDALLDSLNS